MGNAYPNPFNTSLTIPITLPENGMVTFKVYDMLGREVYSFDRHYNAGHHQILFDSKSGKSNFSSGMYILQVAFKDEIHTQKAMFMK
ncbi:T9SS type A sorting domain-containing protein [bacterium]|nr:T9SS type A sorting domain-containing protein [bacterium]